MPRSLKLLCVAYVVLLVLHAALAPFVEQGMEFVFPLVIDTGLVWLFWAFAHRHPWTIKWLSIYCGVVLVIHPLFAIVADAKTRYETAQVAVLWIEMALAVSMLIVLRRNSTKAWFYAPSAP